jgi:ABC-type multidrug transport system ATPase subunit
MVAHKLNTVKGCDRIFLIRKGRITEEGTYNELMEKEGFFSRLVHMHAGTDSSSQFQIEDEEGNEKDEQDGENSKKDMKRYLRRQKRELYRNLYIENNSSANAMSLL